MGTISRLNPNGTGIVSATPLSIRGEDAVLSPTRRQEEHIPLGGILPPIAPPQRNRCMSALLEYKDALENLQRSRIEEKISRGTRLTTQERRTLEIFKSAEKKFQDEAFSAFEAAFTQEHPSVQSVENWEQLSASFETLSKLPDKIKILFVLADQNVKTWDKALLLDLLKIENPSDLAPALSRASERIKFHYLEELSDYNGWQGDRHLNEHSVFLGILFSVVGSQNYEDSMRTIIGSDPSSFLLATTQEERQSLFAMDENSFLAFYNKRIKDFSSLPPGTEGKINLRKKIHDLETIAYARGISVFENNFSILKMSIPGLSEPEYAILFQLGLPFSPFINNKEDFEYAFSYFIRSYMTASISLKSSYANVLNYIEGLALSFDIPLSEIDKIFAKACTANGLDIRARGSIESINELDGTRSVEVSVDGLPKEIKDILVKTGYFELVRNNIGTVALYPEINEGGIELDSSGVAIGVLRRVEIDYLRDGKNISPEEMAIILVHEAAHIDWRRQAPILQNSTPNERHAYAVTIDFIKKIPPPSSPEERTILTSRLEQATRAVERANVIMGYPINDLSPDNTSVPNISLCIERGVFAPEELDLSFYPSGVRPFVSLEELSSYLKKIDPNVAPEVISLLWDIIQERSYLEVFQTSNDPSLTTITVVSNGTRRDLTQEELSGINLITSKKLGHSFEALTGFFGENIRVEYASMDLRSTTEFLAEKPNYEQIFAGMSEMTTNYDISEISGGLRTSLPQFTRLMGRILSNQQYGSMTSLNILSALNIARELMISPERLELYTAAIKSGKVTKEQEKEIRLAIEIKKRLPRTLLSLASIDATVIRLSKKTEEMPFRVSRVLTSADIMSLFDQ